MPSDREAMDRFWVKAKDYAERMGWVKVYQGTEKWRDWERYFIASTGAIPYFMTFLKMTRPGTSATLPAEHPHWFDPEYVAPEEESHAFDHAH